jgi:hypothetical protein
MYVDVERLAIYHQARQRAAAAASENLDLGIAD